MLFLQIEFSPFRCGLGFNIGYRFDRLKLQNNLNIHVNDLKKSADARQKILNLQVLEHVYRGSLEKTLKLTKDDHNKSYTYASLKPVQMNVLTPRYYRLVENASHASEEYKLLGSKKIYDKLFFCI